jgi:hypothetical protein
MVVLESFLKRRVLFEKEAPLPGSGSRKNPRRRLKTGCFGDSRLKAVGPNLAIGVKIQVANYSRIKETAQSGGLGPLGEVAHFN